MSKHSKHRNILICGTMVAALAASSSHAADAIIAAEPDPVEYVRVCDAFGSGFFFIPGTETCLMFSGEVRMRVFTSKADNRDDNRTYNTSYRARLNVDTRSDTELGELRAFIRFQGEGVRDDNKEISVNDPADAVVHQAYLQLGGLFAGYSESAWVTTTNGGASGFGVFGIYDGAYGYQRRNMVQYQFNNANIFAAISLEDDNESTSWAPDIVGRLGGQVGDITVFGVVGYDQSAEDFGVKLGLNMPFADVGGQLRVQGYYASGTTSYGANAGGNIGDRGAQGTPQWSVLGGYSHDLTEDITAYINGQYFANFYDGDSTTGVDAWAVSGGLRWVPVSNFSVTVNAEYSDLVNAPAGDDTDNWRFVTQFARSF